MATGDNVQDVRVVGAPRETKPKDQPTEPEPQEAPLPATEPESFASDVDQTPKEKSITFGTRKYLCHPTFPVRRFTKVQKALVSIAGQRDKEGKLDQEGMRQLIDSFDEVVDVLEVLVVPDAWPELEERIDTNNSPHGSIDQHEILEPIMDLFAQYGERAPGKR